MTEAELKKRVPPEWRTYEQREEYFVRLPTGHYLNTPEYYAVMAPKAVPEEALHRWSITKTSTDNTRELDLFGHFDTFEDALAVALILAKGEQA